MASDSSRLKEVMTLIEAANHALPRRPGFGAAMAALMATPGASTEDPEFLKTIATPKRHDKIVGKQPDFIVYDEVAELPQEVVDQFFTPQEPANMEDAFDMKEALEAVAKTVTDWVKGDGALHNPVGLMAPETLTVVRPNKGYAKVPHIGGEEFKVGSLYVGKRNRLIATLIPVAPADYTQMEMEAVEALSKLDGFDFVMHDALGKSLRDVVGDIHAQKAKVKEAAAVIAKAEQYSDFGSW